LSKNCQKIVKKKKEIKTSGYAFYRYVDLARYSYMAKRKVYIILILKVMPFLPPPALSVDTSQGRDSQKKKKPAKKEQLLKTQI
jgi:hypothetical protein